MKGLGIVTRTKSSEPPVFGRYGYAGRGLPKPLDGQRWYVAQTKPRVEKQAAWLMMEAGVCYFLPMQAKRSASRNLILELIYPGFLFVLGFPEDLYKVWESRRVWGVLKTQDQFQLRADLRRIARVVRAGVALNKMEDIQPGRRVKVIHGHALEGLEARVDLRDRNKVWLDVAMLGARSFQIDAQFLEVLP
jgi:hypothetical protein